MTILLINYYWPPCGGPAVQRWLDFAKRFSNDSISLHVITIDPKVATYTAVDQSLLEEVPKDCIVHTTQSSEWFDFYKKYIGKGKVPSNALADEPNPTFLQKVARFVRGNVFLPDPRRGWNKHAIKKAKEVIEQNHVDLIITAGPPHSSHLIGLKIKSQFNLPWIADFHDFWTDVFYLEKFYRTPIAQFFDRKLEKKVIKKADVILSDVDFGSKLYQSKVPGLKKPFETIRIGYDDIKFKEYKPFLNQEKFTVTYSGTLPSYYNSDVFFAALKNVCQKNSNVTFELKFVGIISPELISKIEEMGLKSILNVKGYLSHKDAVKELFTSTILLLVNPELKNDLGIVPGKIYEYFACKKPIISISSHQSENEVLINKTLTGKNFERSEQSEIESYLQELVNQWNDSKTLDFSHINVEEYSRSNIYRNLIQIIERLIKS